MTSLILESPRALGKRNASSGREAAPSLGRFDITLTLRREQTDETYRVDEACMSRAVDAIDGGLYKLSGHSCCRQLSQQSAPDGRGGQSSESR